MLIAIRKLIYFSGKLLIMKIDILDETTIFKHLNTHKHAFLTDYYAFYSSWFGGITKDPRLMLVPLDDHMNHRGDGVFEAMKAAERSVYLMDEHLDRLLQSAEMIKIKTDLSKSEIKRIILETLQVADQNEAMIRIFLSRGPGSFSVNPYDTIGTQFYVAITAFKPLPSIKYQEGVAIGKSTIPLKSSWLATVKSCNYLPNVMMKKEAVDRNLEFVIGINQEDFLAEGPTENKELLW